MKKLARFLALTLVVASIGGCSSPDSSTDVKNQPETPQQSGSQAVVAGGQQEVNQELEILKIGVADLPKQMDPMLEVGNVGIRIHYNIFETLLLADQKQEFDQKPMLATEWKRLDDKTLQVQLRKGVKFHNGQEMTAKDVQYSFYRLQKELQGIELAASLLNVIEDVEIVDDYMVRIKTKTVDPILEDRIASSWGAWIVPADYLEEVGDEEFAIHPIGTGPYKVVSYSPQKVVLERFDDYWGEKPAAKTIEYIVYPETSARITALITGEVDMITQLPPDQTEIVKAQPGLHVISKNISNMHVLIYNTQAGPLADKKVRQALSLAIDRQLLADTLWGGNAIVPRGHQFEEYGDLYFDDYPLAEYNLEKAKALIEQSSYQGEEITYELRSGYYTFGNEAAEAIVDMWKQIGVNARVEFTDKIEYKFVANWSNTMRFPDPVGGLWLLWGPGSTASSKHWVDMDADFISKGNELASVIDPVKRKELTRQMMEIWDETAPGTVLYYPFESWAVRDGIEWEPYSSQTMDFRAENFKLVP